MFASLDWSALSRDIAACAFKFLGNVKNNIIVDGEQTHTLLRIAS